MKTEHITFALIAAGVIAAAAALANVRTDVNLGAFVGFGTVAAILLVAALDYRVGWKRLFGK